MPANAVAHVSVDCAIAKEVTESSSRERSMSINSESSFFLDALSSDWETKLLDFSRNCMSLSTHYLIWYSASAFSSTTTYKEEAAVVGVEVGGVDGVG